MTDLEQEIARLMQACISYRLDVPMHTNDAAVLGAYHLVAEDRTMYFDKHGRRLS